MGAILMRDKNLKEIYKLSALIGNTPLLAIEFIYKNEKRTIYAKSESRNLTGSVKDRMVFNIIERAYFTGRLKKDDHIIEATSGNTGIAVAAIGSALGHPVTIFMPDWLSSERINLIKSFGANIVLVSKEEGGFLGSINMAKELADKTPNSFLTDQFSNEDNVWAHYKSTGPEIYKQCPNVDAFVAGVGTGGVIMGVGKFLREKNPNVKLYPLEPASSPTLSTGYKVGTHRIEGISDEFIPSILDLDFLDEVIDVDDGDAILMTQKLGNSLGLGVGISSGANFLGAIKAQNKLGSQSIVVTLFTDDNKKYISTDLFKNEPSQQNFISKDITLCAIRSII